MEYKKHLIIFGTKNYENSVGSLIKSSQNFFDKIHVFSNSDIDNEFYEENKKILESRRGAGYWLWKPYFILKVLNEVDYGDIIFYVDAGNVFINSPDELFKLLNENNDILLFDNRDGMQNGLSAQNFISVKKDCFVLMECDTNEYIFGPHLNASYQIYKKSEKSINFVLEYLNFCKNEQILTDTQNKFGDNYPGYYDHRHDQSVLSLLAIKHKINPVVDPSEWGNKCGCRNFNQIFSHHRNPSFKL
jgi:hypothetical protein